MNPSPAIDRSLVVLSTTLITVMVLITGVMAVYVLSDPGLKPAYRLIAAAIRIDESHYETVDHGRLITSARQAMMDRLDRFSNFVTPSRFRQMHELQSGSYSGIGVSVVRDEMGLLIMSVRENGPADEAGFLTGDIIITADSSRLCQLSLQDASELLRGKEGTSVTVELYRPISDDTLQAVLTRSRIPFVHVPYAGYTMDSILYVRLLDFDPGASDEVKAALDSLIPDNGPVPSGIILDLRGNPGGLFSEACETADLFLQEGVFVVGTDGRSRWNEERFYATGEDLTGDLPMTVITDGGTASAAEIVAGALQQAGRAVLVGDTTFGKGLVQGYIRFLDGNGLRLTISRYFFKGDVYLNDFDSTLEDIGHGLVPDYYFRFDVQRHFPQALENSRLLRQFAISCQNEIIAASERPGLDSSWTERFLRFTEESGFEYRSAQTEIAGYIADLTGDKDYHRETRETAGKLLSLTLSNDRQQFFANSDYIETRLKQIAYQRKYSTSRAYKEVVVPDFKAIRFASDIILDK
ncbi:MAG: S41 family peptidase [candidate division Zixibacteria bacterium]|nr:S41 family peptidase [candidate division Zixibacteria bacterium]